MGLATAVKEIIKNGWGKYQAAYGKIIREVEREAVAKVLACGDPKNGYAEYWCLECNGAERRIALLHAKAGFVHHAGKNTLISGLKR